MTAAPFASIATDPDAFETFYRAHVEEVQTYVSRRVGDPTTAADLTADVFLAVIARAHTFDPALGTERMWLYGVTRNVVLGELRRAERHARAVSRVSGRRLLEGDAYQAVADRLDAERESRRLHRRIEGLPRGLRQVIELVGLDGLEVGQAAAVLGIRPGAARVRLHRARRLLSQTEPPDAALATSPTTTPTPRRTRRPRRSTPSSPPCSPSCARSPASSSRPHRRVGGTRRVLLVAAAVGAVTAGVLVAPALLGERPAYAVVEGANGVVDVRVERFEDAAGLERALQDAGVRADITYLPVDTECEDGRYVDAVSPVPTADWETSIGDNGYRLRFSPGVIADDQTVVISAARLSGTPWRDGTRTVGGSTVSLGIAEGPVAPCRPRPVDPAD